MGDRLNEGEWGKRTGDEREGSFAVCFEGEKREASCVSYVRETHK